MKLHPFEELARAVERDRRPPRRITSWPLAVLGLLLIFQPALKAHAGDNFLGTITSTSPTEQTNANTATPFAIGLSAKLTISCDAAAWIATDTGTTVTSANGLPLSSTEKWQTSVTGMCQTGSSGSCTATISGKTSALVRVLSQSGTANCKVFFRNGTE